MFPQNSQKTGITLKLHAQHISTTQHAQTQTHKQTHKQTQNTQPNTQTLTQAQAQENLNHFHE